MLNFPIFITSFNRLEYLKKLISWLDKINYSNVIILDNCSKYQPLIDYYKQIQDKHKVVFLPNNFGHLAVWHCGLFNEILDNSYYIVTDPDVLPIDECPDDAVGFFYEILQREKAATKVGFSLKTDDIPDYYSLKKEVITEQSKHRYISSVYKDINIYHSGIDTTFALYRPGIYPDAAYWYSGIRTGYPYEARHLTWYRDSSAPPTEEDIIYLNSSETFCSVWSRDSKQELERQINDISEKVKNLSLEVKYNCRAFNKLLFYICVFLRHKNLKEYNRTATDPTIEQLFQERQFLHTKAYILERILNIQNVNFKGKLRILYEYILKLTRFK